MPSVYEIPDCPENRFLLEIHDLHFAGRGAPRRGRPTMHVRANKSDGLFNIRLTQKDLEPMGFRIDWDDYDGKNAHQQTQQGAGKPV